MPARASYAGYLLAVEPRAHFEDVRSCRVAFFELGDEVLNELERLSAACDPPPWRASVEGRDHTSGDSFIQVGEDGDRREDMYVSRDSGPAPAADVDLIAAARTHLPALIAELRSHRSR
ncbi:MAG: hypothetical protein ACRDT8_20905 [Micromonosporaceae bacterium]